MKAIRNGFTVAESDDTVAVEGDRFFGAREGGCETSCARAA